MPSVATLRKRARALAAATGCHIVGFGADQTITYWVWPGDQYINDPDGKSYGRWDPNGGDHHACDWLEVIDKLEVYAYDLQLAQHGLSWNCGDPFYRRGVPAGSVRNLLKVADRDILRACTKDPYDTAPWLVLADWLREQGHDQLAGEVARG